MGRRSRKRRDEVAPPGSDAMARGYARGRERDDAIRAGLEPLQPGERPRAVTVAAVVAVAIAVANLIGFLAGWEIDGEQPSTAGVVVFEVLMLAAAWGLWRARYWAVLGFEALLGISLVIAGLGLLVASNWRAVALSLGIFATAGPLFWFLIRAMARIQMPRWPDAR